MDVTAYVKKCTRKLFANPWMVRSLNAYAVVSTHILYGNYKSDDNRKKVKGRGAKKREFSELNTPFKLLERAVFFSPRSKNKIIVSTPLAVKCYETADFLRAESELERKLVLT